MMKNIKVFKYGPKNYFYININDNETINSVKENIISKLNINNKIRLYPIIDSKIITGFSYYGISGDISFMDDYNSIDEFIIYKMF